MWQAWACRAVVIAAGAGVLAAVPASGAGASASGTVTTIDVPGATSTTVNGVSDSGEIVGQYRDSTGIVHGFADQGGTITTIDVPGASSTTATGVGDRGQIVGWYVNATGEHGFEVSPAA